MNFKKVLLWLFILLAVQVANASQMYVVGEVFTENGCPYCPDARSGLLELYQEQDYVVPIMWQHNGSTQTPNVSQRETFYGVTGFPTAMFGGTEDVVGGGSDMYPYYLPKYQQIVAEDSPLEYNVTMQYTASGNLMVGADITVTGNITTSNNKVVYLITQRIDDDHFCVVRDWSYESFNLTQIGDTQHYEHELSYDSSWPLEDMHAIILVQSWSQKKILQAGMTQFTGYLAMFSYDINQGPADLGVHFTNHSFPQNGDITSFEWDFDGDGQIDSTDENPYFVYTEPGTYDVTLHISGNDGEDEKTVTNCITVTENGNVAGDVQGVWRAEHGEYMVTGDINIPEGFQLIIQPGTVVKLDNAKINVAGLFKVLGSVDNPVFLTSENTWNGIEFTYDENDNIIQNAHITNVNASSVIKLDHSKADFIGNRFYSNYGIVIDVNTSNDFTIKNNIFANNANYAGTAGINSVSSIFTVKNNIFVNNQGMSGGVFILRNNSDIHIINNTISNNQSNAIFFVYNSMPEIENSIIWETNNIFTLVNSMPLVSYTCITGGYDGPNNIDSDPMFTAPTEGSGVNYDGLNADWTLQEGSPCIDAGNPAEEYNDIEDPNNPGEALWPAMGTLRNDMGAFGGEGFQNFLDSDVNIINPPSSLEMNVYPNPFVMKTNKAISTTIAFNLKDTQPVSLEVYNLKGQKIKTIYNGVAKKGLNVYSWNATDKENRKVSSGVYFYLLKTQSETATKKIAIIK